MLVLISYDALTSLRYTTFYCSKEISILFDNTFVPSILVLNILSIEELFSLAELMGLLFPCILALALQSPYSRDLGYLDLRL